MYEQEKSEIKSLKSYLLNTIPHTPLSNDILLTSNSVAIKAAVAGLDKELARLEREERLVSKFTAAASSSSISSGQVVHDNSGGDEDVAMEYVKMSKDDIADTDNMDAPSLDDVNEEEWEQTDLSPAKQVHHTSNSSNKEEENGNGDRINELLCQKWASSSIARISQANAKVDTSLGALGLVLHTALLELSSATSNNKANKSGCSSNGDDSIFRCTGVPTAEVLSQLLMGSHQHSGGSIVSKGGGGFAPPIRELPRGVLVPPKWEVFAASGGNTVNDQGVVAFRYKCGKEVYSSDSGNVIDTTTVYLVVQELEDENEVLVNFGPFPSSADTTAVPFVQFPISQHVNLDGFQAAKSKSGGSAVPPSLFYKSLTGLLSRFGSEFGLMPALQRTFEEATAVDAEMNVTDDATGMATMNEETMTTTEIPSTQAKPTTYNVPRPNIPPNGPAIDTDPLRISHNNRGKHGDFEGDLLPGGPQPGILPPNNGPDIGRGGLGGGSQVGPNHPLFDRTFGDDAEGYYEDELGGYGAGDGGNFGIPGMGGLGMRPRFDPYGPPGGPTEPGRGGRGGRGRLGTGRGGRGRGGGRGFPPGGFGNPNNDHMPPPGSDYFS
ncbi:predicted protein [Thalassiosira pseudonana CCMP1335]|uniref:PI31 proteasome regulator N-terminal domain-containing protein n=1 Tax=Thalassiosira pseudonana TaxID=35128 RepID=B8CA77_THAPS|nr:predicted protein [Thalassiosira pseudonana CCMP1335]EED89458.1 predicted protein [Thalassiosira pseudonana CCMP1335]